MKQDRSSSRPSRFRSLKGAQRAGAKSAISPLRAILPILLLAILGLGLVLSSNKVPQASASLQTKGGASISDEAARQIQALIDEKESRTPAQKKIDSQLIYALKSSRNQAIAAGVPTLEIGAKIDSQNNTVVDIRLAHVTDLKAVYKFLEQTGDVVLSAVYNNIRARVNLERLEALAARPDVRFIMPKQEAMTAGQSAFGGQMSPLTGLPMTPGLSEGFADRAARVRAQLLSALQPLGIYRKTSQQAGKVGPAQTNVVNTSEGDKTHKADVGRSSFGISGAGVKVGVLSDGVSSLAAVQATGDLPAGVTVLPGQTGSGDEGTAMLEIVHDLAPNAQLFFATAFTSITSFAQNIRDLRTAGCDIIIDDVGYFVETPLQDGQAPAVVSPSNGGVVLQAVNDVTAAGAMYFSSAGNEGNVDKATAGVWEGDFVNGGTLALVPGGNLNDFDPGAGVAQSNALTVGTSAPVTLFWSDPLGGSANDYDLFILNSTSTSVLASSTNIQNGDDDPIEILGVTTPAGRRAVILQKTGAANRFLHLNTFRGALTFGTTGQTHGHNQGALAYSVAATPAAVTPFGGPNGPFPNPFNSTNKIETFSSDGPRRILYNANSTPITPGNVSSTGGVLRQKPDITAADGVMCAAPGFNPFFGTSAAAPHAGAIAALVKSANLSLTPAQIRTALTSTAIDIEGAGVDRDSGAGIVMAFEALQAVGAAPTAVITSAGATLVSESCAPANGAIDPGETVTVSLCVQNTGASNTTALMGTLQATGGVTNIQPPNPQNYGVVVAGGPAVCRNFTFTASGACGGTITATVHFVDGATDLGNVTYTFSLGALGTPLTFSFTGPAVTIPDNSAAGVNIPITVSGVGSVGDINFRIDGSSCNTNNPSLTVGVDHSWVGDLKFTLTAPNGTTSVIMMNRPGGGTFGSSGNNFCQTLLDDDGAFPSIQSIASTGAPPLGPPYTGTFTPSSPLSGFDGVAADGTWMLNVSDNAAGDTGFVRAFSLILTPLVCSTSCATPCVITCPANITKSNDPNQCGAVVTYPAPTTTGSCGTVTCTPPSGSFFPVGTTTVTCQAVDNGGGTAATPKAPKGAPGCTTITESTSQAIVDNNSVSCNNGIGHTDNSYWRAFTLSSFGINNAFDVQSVDVGIELASAGVAGVQAAAPGITKHKTISGGHTINGGGSQPITVNIYTSSSPFPTGFPGSLTLIGTTSTTIADQSDTIINIPVTGTAPPGSQLVVEVFTPDGEAAGNLIFIGSNTAAETGPSYLSAAACGVATPTTTAALGFPDMHIVMNVNGCEQVQGNGPTCTFTVTVNDTQPPVITCPPNQTAVTPNVNSPCAVVTFTTTASDNCPGVTVVCNPPSGSCFPIGVTTVTCTATDAHSNTATCSFTVSVFNGRLEDDSESCNDSVLFNTLTGDYRWCCHGTTFTGRGKVTRSGDTIALSHVAADRRVLINLAAGAPTPTGNGSLQFPAGTTRCVLSDRDIRNDTCLCGNAPPPSSKK